MGKRFAHKRDQGYQDWVRHQPCILRGVHDCKDSEVVHLISVARGSWDYANIIPVCHESHMYQHAHGIYSWLGVCISKGVNPWEDAVRLFQRWLDLQHAEQGVL